ncbi:hypothetical protein [Desulfonatronospira sp.]|uniref:hypothetical protein n=1 Tax=Desulfonatronospira sp. TaxID=1962951 RepID=UPI0025C17B13|nr:hypothetical protein [Desulfonatronospira sp.]
MRTSICLALLWKAGDRHPRTYFSLNTVEDAPFIYRGKYIPNAYDQYVSTLERSVRYAQGESRLNSGISRGVMPA